MNDTLIKIKRLFLRFKALFPSRLPIGMSEFSEWADSIIFIYDLPDNDSVKFALATEVLHTAAGKIYKSKEYYGRAMLKGAANEIAAAVMQDLKAKQKARIEAEATAKSMAVSDGQSK